MISLGNIYSHKHLYKITSLNFGIRKNILRKFEKPKDLIIEEKVSFVNISFS